LINGAIIVSKKVASTLDKAQAAFPSAIIQDTAP
jgi:hypothetical protein